MIPVDVVVSGTKELGAGLEAIAARVKDRTALHAMAGHIWVFQEMPQVFRDKGPGWARPKRRLGSPLEDTGRLRDSWAYKADASDARIGTNAPGAITHQEGRRIVPRHGMFLLIPLTPPLSITEARAFPRGKFAIQARYPGSFFLMHGPEGPGIYRKTSRVAYTVGSRVKHQVVERIAAAVKSVKVDPRPMAKKTDRVLRAIDAAWGPWVAYGQGSLSAPSGGNPDVGPRGGQLE